MELITEDTWYYLLKSDFLTFEVQTHLIHTNAYLRCQVLRHTFDTQQFFNSAARFGYTTLFHHFYTKVDVCYNNNAALVDAATGGHNGIIKRLCRDARVDVTHPDQRALSRAIKNGHTAVVRNLLSASSKFDLRNRHYLRGAKNAVGVVSLLLQDTRHGDHDIPKAFQLAVRQHYLATATLLADHPDSVLDDSNDIYDLAKAGYLDMLKIVVPRLPKYKMSLEPDWLYIAVQNRHDNCARYLYTCNEWSTRVCTKVVCHAMTNGNGLHTFAHQILSTKRVHIRFDRHVLYRGACRHGIVPILKYLLRTYRCNAGMYNNKGIRLAAANGREAAVAFLLTQPTIDPSAMVNDAIQAAAAHGHLAVVKQLMQDERVDPYDDNERARRLARRNKHEAIVKLLTREKLVQPLVKEPPHRWRWQRALFRACYADDAKAMRVILKKDTLWDAYDDLHLTMELAKWLKKYEVLYVLQNYQLYELEQKRTARYAAQALGRWKEDANVSPGYGEESLAFAQPHEQARLNRERAQNPNLEPWQYYWDNRADLGELRNNDEMLWCPSTEAHDAATRRMEIWRKPIKHKMITDKELYAHMRPRIGEISNLTGCEAERQELALRESQFHVDTMELFNNYKDISKQDFVHNGKSSSQVDSHLRTPKYRPDEIKRAETLGDPMCWIEERYIDRRVRHEPSQQDEYGWSENEEEDVSSLF